MALHATDTNWWQDVLESTGSTPTPRRHKGTDDLQREEIYARALARAHLAELRGRRTSSSALYH